jgi:hypothetical protein
MYTITQYLSSTYIHNVATTFLLNSIIFHFLFLPPSNTEFDEEEADEATSFFSA